MLGIPKRGASGDPLEAGSRVGCSTCCGEGAVHTALRNCGRWHVTYMPNATWRRRGVASARGGGSPTRRAPQSGGLHKRSAEDWGHSLRARGAELLSVLRTCVTKQTKDLRYIGLEAAWFLSFGRTHDDAVCPGKRVVSWINACSSCRATKKKKCRFQSSAVSSGCHGPLATGGLTVIKRVDRRDC